MDVCVYRDRDDAVEEARRLADETRRVGRGERHYVAEIEDSADWDEIGPTDNGSRERHAEALQNGSDRA